MLFFPISLHQVMAAGVRLAGKHGEHLVSALSFIEWRNERLHNTDRSVVCPRVTPGFEVICLVHVPLAKFGGFVLIKAEVHADRDLSVPERVGEAEVCGRVVSRIAAQYHEQIDFAAAHVGDKVFQRFGLVDRVGVDGVGVENCLADVA